MQINILLPYKEKFDKYKASSVSLTIKNNLNHSLYLKNIKIYGQNVDQPIFKKNIVRITYSIFSLMSKNSFLAHKMLKFISKNNNNKQIIELHNRPYLVEKLFKSNFPIILFLHNDPQTMKGTKSVEDRKKILEKCAVVFCVSKYVKNQFLNGISYNTHKVHVLYNGVERTLKNFPQKKKEILFVGRLTHEKGVHLYVKAIKSIYSNYPDWKFGLIGSYRLGDDNIINSYGHKVKKEFETIGSNAKFYGFQNHKFVYKKMKTTAIIIIPSLWKEPFGLVAAEAMSNGISIIASKSGGITEIVKGNGILIENMNHENLKKNLINLMSNDKIRENYQKKAWNNFIFTSKTSSKKLDDFRRIIFQDYF